MDCESLVKTLLEHQHESEWVEFKKDNADPVRIGQSISALSNGAALCGKDFAYLVWGIDDESLEPIGTNFDYRTKKVGNEELQIWLANTLSDNVDYSFESCEIDGKKIVVLKITAAAFHPTTFQGKAHIRVGSCTQELSRQRGHEGRLWKQLRGQGFEDQIAFDGCNVEDILELINHQSYVKLLKYESSDSRQLIDYMLQDRIITKQDDGNYSITNLGYILFANDLDACRGLARKAVRIIKYTGTSKMASSREIANHKGYAAGFNDVLSAVELLVPSVEEIDSSGLRHVRTIPNLALRELIANALIHQDFSISGAGPIIEIYDDRVEISNPGSPLIEVKRVIDSPPQSRNEALAGLMRRANICEERGSGWDKVALSCEQNYLPAPKMLRYEHATRVVIYSYLAFSAIPQDEKIWTCYLHACLLREISGEQLTNSSVRARFGLSDKQTSTASRLISSTVNAGLIRQFDTATAQRYWRYVPFWAE